MANSLNLTYSEKVLKLIRSPKNMGEIKDADGVGMVGNPVCGDLMKLYIKVGKKKGSGDEYIKDIKFQTLGCGAAIANSSIITTLVKGKLLKDVQDISKESLVEALGGLPTMKVHCSVLANEALTKAINDYYSRKE